MGRVVVKHKRPGSDLMPMGIDSMDNYETDSHPFFLPYLPAMRHTLLLCSMFLPGCAASPKEEPACHGMTPPKL